MTLGNLWPIARLTLVRLQPDGPLPRARSAGTLAGSVKSAAPGRGNTVTGAHVSDWERFAADVYLDRRYRNWIINEEMGDVRFLPEAGIVLVHRLRAEHIVRELLVNPKPVGIPAARRLSITTRPVSSSMRRVTVSLPPRAIAPLSRWRMFTGWLGLGTATAVFVATLAIRLDDAALLLALSLFLWGGRLILENAPIPA